MPDVLNGMMPGLGRDWTEILGALSVVYCVYFYREIFIER
jgi:hypothetical protein